MDRRTTLKWILAAATMPVLGRPGQSESALRGSHDVPSTAAGYGTDPDLLASYKAGDLWPLTFTPAQRHTATVLCDLIIPADARSPSASAVGVVDFVDEWISAPYPEQRRDREVVLAGFDWLDGESVRRSGRRFVSLEAVHRSAICNDISYLPRAEPRLTAAARFFALYRNLTAGGFYTTPVGRDDLQYLGNVALARFDGPPLEVLRRAGLA